MGPGISVVYDVDHASALASLCTGWERVSENREGSHVMSVLYGWPLWRLKQVGSGPAGRVRLLPALTVGCRETMISTHFLNPGPPLSSPPAPTWGLPAK